MKRLHGFVLIINALLPAIIGLALVALYFVLVGPMINDYRAIQASLGSLEEVGKKVGAQYETTSAAVEKHIDDMQNDFAPIIGLYDGVHKLSEDFCGNIGRVDFSALPRSGLQVAQLNGLSPLEGAAPIRSSASAMVALNLPDLGKAAQDALREADRLRREGERKASEVWKKIRGGGEEALKFGGTSACRASETAFQATFTVLGTLMSPFGEIGQVVRQLEKLYGTLEIDKTLPELQNIRARVGSIRDGAARLYTALSYLGLALVLWFVIPYVSWALSRLQQGWEMLKR